MRKVILFAVILGILTGGILFYAQKMQEETAPKVVVHKLKEEIKIISKRMSER